MWGWFRPTTDRNAFSGWLAINSAVDALNWLSIQSQADGTTMELSDGNGSGSALTASMFSATVNTWYFVAFTSAGTAGGSSIAYWRTLAQNALSTSNITGASSRSTTVGAMEFGRDGFVGEYMSGEMHAIGCANAVLSADELLELSYFHEPQLDGIRSLNVFYPIIESVNTNATVDRSGNARNATATVGALADAPALLWRSVVNSMPLPATGSADVTLALTGVSSTASVGTLALAHDQALSGNAGTGAPGTLAVNHSQAITGNSSASSAGSIVPSSAVALLGNAAAGQVGTLGAAGDEADALTGVSATSGVGTLGVSHAQAITGNAATGSVGTLAPAHSQAITGSAATGAVGTLAPSTTIGVSGNAATGAVGSVGAAGAGSSSLSGVSAIVGVGSLGVSDSMAISGNAATGEVGALTPQVATNSAQLTGVSASGEVGTMTAVGGAVSDSFLPDWFSFLKADAGIAALAGERIYPLLIPQHIYTRVTQQPVIVFTRIGGRRTANYCETERIVVGNYQFDCYARKYEDAIALGEALRFALEDYVGMVGGVRVRLTRQDNEFELIDPEPGLYRVSSDWSIWYIETV